MTEEKKKRRRGAAEHGHEAPEKDESEIRWLISYSDFMMQLVCLFILLYSVSSTDVGRATAVSDSWRNAMGLEPLTVEDAPVGADAAPLTPAELVQIVEEVRIACGRFPEGKNITVSPLADGFELQLLHPMFEEGGSELTSTGAQLIDIAASVIQPYERRVGSIEAVGHASAKEGDREGGSALRLSLSRARTAVRRVAREDLKDRLDERRLAAGGRGFHDPAADNASDQDRANNRRVDFVVRFNVEAKP